MKKDKTMEIVVKNINKAQNFLKDLEKLMGILNSTYSISRDEPMEKYYLKKYNIKLEHKKKDGMQYYICNKSKYELTKLFTSKTKIER